MTDISDDEFYDTLCEAAAEIEAGIKRAKEVLRKSPFFKDKEDGDLDYEIHQLMKDLTD